jgi:hypothetical protein
MVLLGNPSAHHAISERMTFVVYGVMGQVTSKKLDEERSHFQELRKELEHHRT